MIRSSKMKKRLILVLLIASAIMGGACSFSNITIGQRALRGSGDVITETRQVSNFTRIELDGSGDVEIVFADKESITIEAEDNIMPLIETKVSNGVLNIGFKSNTSVTTFKPIRFTIEMKSLEGVRIDGSGDVHIPESAFDALDLEINGSGDIQANGTAEILDVRLDGSGNINCADLTARSAVVNVNGSGSAKIDVTDSLNIDISGSGSVRYSGDPATLHTNVSGSGSIKKTD